MKNLIATLLLCITYWPFLVSQNCIIDQSFIDSTSGIYPLPYYEATSSGGITYHPVIGCPYEYAFQVSVHNFNGPGCGSNTEINSLEITDMFNLPDGLTYSCDPPNCKFEADGVGCISVSGIPTTANTAGTFHLQLLSTVTLLGGQLIIEDTFPGVLSNGGHYYLYLSPEPVDDNSCPEIPVGIENLNITSFSAVISPNPISDIAFLTVNSDRNNKLYFQITNLTGTLLQHRVLNVDAGETSFEITTEGLASGIYLYSLRNEDGVISDKILVSK